MKTSRNKWVKLHACEIEHEKALNDAEVRLFYIFLRIVGWDSKHFETFGSIKITIRDLMGYFDWSQGKVDYTLNGLIKKGWLERRADKKIAVRGYWLYRLKSVQAFEQQIQLVRQGVQKNERVVQPAEKDGRERQEIVREVNKANSPISNQFVQLAEQMRFPKEPLKNNKDP